MKAAADRIRRTMAATKSWSAWLLEASFVGALAFVLSLASVQAADNRAEAVNFSEAHSFVGLNRPVPDGSASGVSDSRIVSSAIAQITGLRIKLEVAGEFNGDLYGYLRHVHGATTNFCVLLNRPGRTASDPVGYADSGLDVIFDDAGTNGDIHTCQHVTTPQAGWPLTGAWQPDGREVDPLVVLDTDLRTTALSSFHGAEASGAWTLFLADMDSGGTNLLVSWELEIVGRMRPDLNWSIPSCIVYGTPLSSAELNATASVPGTFTYTPPAGTVLNAGSNQPLSVVFVPENASSYLSVTSQVSLHVLKKPLTIRADDKSLLCGADWPLLSATYSGFVNGDTETSLDTPLILATEATTSSPPGVYSIIASNATDANYDITFAPGTLTVFSPQVTGQVILEAYAGLHGDRTGQRTVTFAATDGAAFTNRWEVSLAFVDGVANFTLDVPPGATRVSVKTAWHLRKTLPLSFSSGQAVADFKGENLLRCGDLDGSNQVEMGDYLALAAMWYTFAPAADMDGNGRVDLDDYFILANNWHLRGDPE